MSPSTQSRENRAFASEIKFVTSPRLAEQIRDWARARLSPDPNGAGGQGDTYCISSLYFDTSRFDVFHRQGSYGRSKFRIRRYGSAEVLFLERKLKTRGLVTKRRSIVPRDEVERLAVDELDRDWAGFWFHRRLLRRRLRPVCQISYRRTARVAMTAYGPIRLTLDENIRALPADEFSFSDEAGGLILENQTVIEMKFLRFLPAAFKNLAEEFALNPRPFSKYRQAAASLHLVNVDAPNFPQPMILEYA